MAHKYYDDLANKKPNHATCLFNTDEREQDSDGQDSDRQKRWDAQRSEYGFDDRETWSLDFTASTWLHSHLCMFKDIGGEIVNFDFHSFDIPVIKESPRYDKNEIPCDDNPPVVEVIEKHTQGEAIDIMIDYLSEYIKLDFGGSTLEEDYISIRKARCAFKIFSEVFATMWW